MNKPTRYKAMVTVRTRNGMSVPYTVEIAGWATFRDLLSHACHALHDAQPNIESGYEITSVRPLIEKGELVVAS